MAPAGRGAWAAQGRPPGQQRALERPPGLEGWKKPSSSSSVSESAMLQLRRPPLGALQLRRPQLGVLLLRRPPLGLHPLCQPPKGLLQHQQLPLEVLQLRRPPPGALQPQVPVHWGTSQELHKFPKREVIQPPHPPPVEGLIKGTVEQVLQCRIVEPQILCCVAELLGKHPAQGLELEDALVEGTGQCGGWWWTVQALPPLGPLHGGFVLSGWVEGKRARTQLQEEKLAFYS